MKPEIQILHLEDDVYDHELIQSRLKREGVRCVLERAKNREEFVAALERGGFDLVCSDFSIPGFSGLKALALAREKCPQIPFLFVSGTLGEEVAIDTLKAGATDYVLKDRLARLVPAIRRAVAEAEERQHRRKAEEAMVLSEYKYRHLFEFLGDAAFLCDPSSERVLDTNKEAERLLQRERLEIIGLHQSEFHAAHTMEHYRRWLEQIDSKTGRWNFEGEVLCENGRPIPVAITATPITLHDRRLVLSLYSNLTTRKQLEQQMRQSQKMEAIGRLASGIAHDINNFVSPVLGFSDLLLQGEFELNAKARKYVELIGTAGRDIAQIVARLNEFYRPDLNGHALEEIDLNQLVEQAACLTRPRWHDLPNSRGQSIEVSVDLTPHLPGILGLESEIRAAIINLLLNAADALPRGGTITCRTLLGHGALSSSGTDISQSIVLEIEDNGMGMSEETRRRCLEPFFSTKGTKGTGLGLSTVCGLMKQLRGTIEIESQSGKGTLIRLLFPIGQHNSEATPKAINDEVPEPRRILYIDDEPLLCELLKELLEVDGHQVDVVDGGEAGLQRFRSARTNGRDFDLVITDLGMPGLDGRQVARLLKQESPTTPVALLTGWAASTHERDGLPAHIDAILTKPPRLAELRRLVSGLPIQANNDYENSHSIST